VKETPLFQELAQSGARAKTPIFDILRYHRRQLVLGAGVRIGPDVVYSVVFVFSLTYITTVLNLSRPFALTAIMIGTVFNAVTIPLFGALSDRVGRRPVYAAGVLAGLPWAFVFFRIVDNTRPIFIVLIIVLGGMIHAAMYGPQAAFIVEQFPTRVRYAGASLAYALAAILGAGIAPLILVSLLQAWRTTMALSLYVTASLCVTGVLLLMSRETAKCPLKE
jgi:MFS family permease